MQCGLRDEVIWFRWGILKMTTIPVGTGNTYLFAQLMTTNAVHPRGYGEHQRVRVNTINKNRFIPVGTGNTLVIMITFMPTTVHPRGHGEHVAIRSRSTMVSVHPRGHGEHRLDICKPVDFSGSSPWARGTLFNTMKPSFFLRFIPVGTGNTLASLIDVFGITVHPRGHGEHAKFLTRHRIIVGSSPWARGTRRITSNCCFIPRFIPVGTGNT